MAITALKVLLQGFFAQPTHFAPPTHRVCVALVYEVMRRAKRLRVTAEVGGDVVDPPPAVTAAEVGGDVVDPPPAVTARRAISVEPVARFARGRPSKFASPPRGALRGGYLWRRGGGYCVREEFRRVCRLSPWEAFTLAHELVFAGHAVGFEYYRRVIEVVCAARERGERTRSVLLGGGCIVVTTMLGEGCSVRSMPLGRARGPVLERSVGYEHRRVFDISDMDAAVASLRAERVERGFGPLLRGARLRACRYLAAYVYGGGDARGEGAVGGGAAAGAGDARGGGAVGGGAGVDVGGCAWLRSGEPVEVRFIDSEPYAFRELCGAVLEEIAAYLSPGDVYRWCLTSVCFFLSVAGLGRSCPSDPLVLARRLLRRSFTAGLRRYLVRRAVVEPGRDHLEHWHPDVWLAGSSMLQIIGGEAWADSDIDLYYTAGGQVVGAEHAESSCPVLGCCCAGCRTAFWMKRIGLTSRWNRDDIEADADEHSPTKSFEVTGRVWSRGVPGEYDVGGELVPEEPWLRVPGVDPVRKVDVIHGPVRFYDLQARRAFVAAFSRTDPAPPARVSAEGVIADFDVPICMARSNGRAYRVPLPHDTFQRICHVRRSTATVHARSLCTGSEHVALCGVMVCGGGDGRCVDPGVLEMRRRAKYKARGYTLLVQPRSLFVGEYGCWHLAGTTFACAGLLYDAGGFLVGVDRAYWMGVEAMLLRFELGTYSPIAAVRRTTRGPLVSARACGGGVELDWQTTRRRAASWRLALAAAPGARDEAGLTIAEREGHHPLGWRRPGMQSHDLSRRGAHRIAVKYKSERGPLLYGAVRQMQLTARHREARLVARLRESLGVSTMAARAWGESPSGAAGRVRRALCRLQRHGHVERTWGVQRSLLTGGGVSARWVEERAETPPPVLGLVPLEEDSIAQGMDHAHDAVLRAVDARGCGGGLTFLELMQGRGYTCRPLHLPPVDSTAPVRRDDDWWGGSLLRRVLVGASGGAQGGMAGGANPTTTTAQRRESGVVRVRHRPSQAPSWTRSESDGEGGASPDECDVDECDNDLDFVRDHDVDHIRDHDRDNERCRFVRDHDQTCIYDDFPTSSDELPESSDDGLPESDTETCPLHRYRAAIRDHVSTWPRKHEYTVRRDPSTGGVFWFDDPGVHWHRGSDVDMLPALGACLHTGLPPRLVHPDATCAGHGHGTDGVCERCALGLCAVLDAEAECDVGRV